LVIVAFSPLEGGRLVGGACFLAGLAGEDLLGMRRELLNFTAAIAWRGNVSK
jgi:hypothetical protein